VKEKLRINPISLSGIVGDEALLGVSIATTGEAVGHRLLFDETSLQQLQKLAAAKARGVKSRFTHPDWFHDGLGKYLGRFINFRVDGPKLVADLQLSKTSHSSPAGDIGRYVLDLAREDPSALGVSVVVDLFREWPTGNHEDLPVARITELYAADVVDEPALNPGGLFQKAPTPTPRGAAPTVGADGLFETVNSSNQGETEMTLPALPEDEIPNPEPEPTLDQVMGRLSAMQAEINQLQSTSENQVIQIGNRPPRGLIAGMPAAIEQFQAYFDWLFGAPGAQLPPPELRRADALYRAVTGDVEMRGVFDPSRAAFAAATTTTLADLAVNAMNKVVIDLYTNLTAYRWYEQIVAVQATDGSLHDMQWLQFGGIGNLPVVAEGAAYTELTVTDTKETSSFYKYGGYVGITDKMIRNSKIDQIQAVPRALTISAIRTRSAAIAAIFTTASGTGPTLAQDSTVLFHSNHGNVATTAYSIAAWKAARLECVKQAELGSSKRQVLWPRYLLVPVDLYDQALIDFGFGAGPGGYPGTPNNDVNPYAEGRPGDPRPSVIAVPEWTDTGDWAYIVDPALAPVICMAYGDNPGGRTHPAPQLYSVTDPTSGLLFTNDTLPIKVRDLWAYGVATYRGIGKRNVA
jgi:HK97 family phage major capsid protein